MRKIQLTHTVPGAGLTTLHQILSLHDSTYEEVILILHDNPYEEVTLTLTFTDEGTIHTEIKLPKVTKLLKSITRI